MTTKRYRHVTGFTDGTDHVLVDDGVVYLVLDNIARRRAPDITQAACDRYVSKGIWRELKEDEQK